MQLEKPTILFFYNRSEFAQTILKTLKSFDAYIITPADFPALQSALLEQNYDLLICQSEPNNQTLHSVIDEHSKDLATITTCLVTTHLESTVPGFDFQVTEENLKSANFYEHYFLDIFELTKKHKAQNELSAMLLHDLRSPAQSLLGYLELLEKEVFGEINAGQARILQNAVTVGDHIIELMESLSFVQQFEKKQFSLNKTKVHLKVLIDDTLRSLWIQADRKNIKFIPQVAHDLPDIIADNQGVQRVLNNLLHNAIKYSPENGTVRIMVKCTDPDSKPQKLQVRIIDSGPGIPASQLNYIFDKYYRIRRDAVRTKGQGLGLYIAKLIIDAHNGDIDAYNNREGGATFFFTLPLTGTLPENSNPALESPTG